MYRKHYPSEGALPSELPPALGALSRHYLWQQKLWIIEALADEIDKDLTSPNSFCAGSGTALAKQSFVTS